ncbi:hypothetical protein [Marilutibacter spongiae]|uniref:Uncharacterized protein n=1 Tax=Marilutibacter spongiae TaxID=2025720 RepID=A0A7W3TJY6_9GAMM|nr:hypothetical protein [Lysobacter spongiae]MBB1059707.1 hypothetical protein [Lysobacter spongiae]
MILDSMLAHSPVLLCLASALLLLGYGAVRLVQAGVRAGRRCLGTGGAQAGMSHHA